MIGFVVLLSIIIMKHQFIIGCLDRFERIEGFFAILSFHYFD